jgi:hypothetical protein
MCRKAKVCVLLGDNPSVWSSRIPLPPPDWFEGQAYLFRDAAQYAASGDTPAALEILHQIRDAEMRDWFCIHGQNSGYFRAKKFNIPVSRISSTPLDPRRSPAKFERAVFMRDSYTCRYCGLKVIAKEAMYAFEKLVGVAEFRTQGCNDVQHGCIHAFKPVADHVAPHHLGGRTDMNNLVTACPACNYGKYNYTVAQLGIDDPCERPPIETDWDGLLPLVAGLTATTCNRR